MQSINFTHNLGLFYYQKNNFIISYIRLGGMFMYYYGGYSGYGNQYPCGGYPNQGYQSGYGAAVILVLFILLVIIIGARSWNNN